MTDCIFCKIVAGDIPSHKVYEDEHVLAFLNIRPAAEGHVLVIPKVHEPTLPELSNPGAVINVAKLVDLRLREVLSCDAVSLLLRDGPAAGQEIPHLHLHLIPRYDGDGLGAGYHEGSQEDMEKLQSLKKKLSF